MGEGDTMSTVVLHAESGTDIRSTYNLHCSGDKSQDWGSAITYAKRYALGCMLNLCIDKDDDGNRSSGYSNQQQSRPEPQPEPQPTTNNNGDGGDYVSRMEALLQRVPKGHFYEGFLIDRLAKHQQWDNVRWSDKQIALLSKAEHEFPAAPF
jgi:hypothetical protein